MEIREDYSYLTTIHKEMMRLGLATLDVYNVHIEGNGKSANEEIKSICDMLDKEFLIYQYRKNPDGKYVCEYRDKWDLYFFNNGCLEYPFTDTRLSFNKNQKELKERKCDFNKLIDILRQYKVMADIEVRVQYTAVFNDLVIKAKADAVFETLENTFVEYKGMTGKIKRVQENSDGYYGTKTEYGFFKKGSKKKYYIITNMDLVMMEQNEKVA